MIGGRERTPASARPKTSALRGLRVRVLLLAGSLAASVLVLEGGLRIYAKVMHKERGMAYDAELGWRPLPNLKKFGGVWGVRNPASTNSHGWRDQERSYEKSAGVRRVVALGDSFTFGTEADDGERFTDVLPRLADRLEVVNLGVAGYGPDQELRVLETQALRYRPDAVVVTFCVYNDLQDIQYEFAYGWPKPSYLLTPDGVHLRPPRLSWQIRARGVSYLVEALFLSLRSDDYRRTPTPGFDPSDAPRLFEVLVRQMAGLAAERGVPLIAVLAHGPDENDAAAREAARTIAGALDRIGIPAIDARKLFATRSPSPSRTFFVPGGRHWNADGHALVAEAIRDLLATLGITS